MQKFTAILEKNVEWFALGIAGLFFLWMIYGYVVEKPVTATVGSAQVAPGDVDPLILNGPAREVQKKMDDPSVPQMVVVEFNKDLTEQLSGKHIEVASIQNVFVGPANPIGGRVEAPIVVQGPVVNLVKELPNPPAPINLQTSQGRSNVQISAPGAAPAAPVANPGQAAGTDRNWVSVSAVIPMRALADEFAAKKIPQQLNTTTLLRLEMVREELQPDGSWANETPIPPLQNVSLQPLPPAAAPAGQPLNIFVDQANAYQQYAEKEQKNLLQPDFYQVLQADPWVVPGQAPAAGVALVAQAFDPATFRGNPKDLTDEQRKALQEYRRTEDERKRREASERYRQRNQSKGGGRGGAPAGGGYRPPAGGGLRETSPLRGFSPAPIDADRPISLAQAYRPNPVFADGETEPGQLAQPGQALPPGAPPIGVLPAGSFDPAVLAAGPALPTPPPQPGQALPQLPALNPGDVTIWAHDDSVQPGHTYRYRVRYSIRNPVFASRGACNPQKLADQFILQSGFSEWTKDIAIKAETNFFAVGASPAGATTVKAKFEIFRFKDGRMQMQSVEVTPGDMVGGAQGSGAGAVDFTTNLSLVDVRADSKSPENRIILLTGENGQIVRHDLTSDRNSDEYKKLREQVQAGNKPVAAAGGAAPFAP